MKPKDYDPLFDHLSGKTSATYLNALIKATRNAVEKPSHGDFQRWQSILHQLPAITSSKLELQQAVITIGQSSDANIPILEQLRHLLLQLRPWRKGPFNVFGVEINSEWRSDIKWSRLAPHLPPLKNLRLLDVGCGNGYYLLRMLGEGASCVVGVDPSLLFNAQFSALKTYIGQHLPAYILPLRFEDMVEETSLFDGVFSMGVIYHRKDPLEHLLNLRKMLLPGGFLVMESIVWNEDSSRCLIPKQRYAGMRNVWSIPTPLQMEHWLQKTRWTDILYVSQEPTSLQEQRRTEWMPFHSLAEFLDPANNAYTMEGYPAPVRGIWIARKTDT